MSNQMLSFFIRCWCWAWRKWCAPRELKSRTVYIGNRYAGDDKKKKNLIKNEIRNQVGDVVEC